MSLVKSSFDEDVLCFVDSDKVICISDSFKLSVSRLKAWFGVNFDVALKLPATNEK